MVNRLQLLILNQDNVADHEIISITVVNCRYGCWQKYDDDHKFNTKLFARLPCSYGQYTMKRKECVTREVDTIAYRQNNVTIEKGYYASETSAIYLTVHQCPSGCCCDETT